MALDKEKMVRGSKPKWVYTKTGEGPAYLSLKGEIGRGEVAKSVPISDFIILDEDGDGNVIGIEFL